MATTMGNGTVTFGDTTLQGSAWKGIQYQYFDTSGTFTVPAGVTQVRVCVAAGGGGGSGLQGYYSRSADGGSGAIAEAIVSGLTDGQNIIVTVGSGGVGGYGSYSAAATGSTDGQTSSFGSYVTCTGGTRGQYLVTGVNGTVSVGAGARLVNKTGWVSFGIGYSGTGDGYGTIGSSGGAGGAGSGGGGGAGNAAGAGGLANGLGDNGANGNGNAGGAGGRGISGATNNGGAGGSYWGGGGGGGGAVIVTW